MSNYFLEGAVISAPAYQTIDRYGNTIPAGVEKPRLLLKEFLPNSLFAFALEIYQEKSSGLISLPVKILSRKDIPSITTLFVNKNELLGRLCLKGIKKRKEKTEQNEEFVNYIYQKSDYFLRLPKIIEEARKILISHKKSFHKLEADEQTFLTPRVLIECVRRHYKHLAMEVDKFFYYNILYVTTTYKILGKENVNKDLDLSLIKKEPPSDRILGSGTFGSITKQWHVPSGEYLAYKSPHDLFVDREVANESIEREYHILKRLHSCEISSSLALPPMPRILYKSIDTIDPPMKISVGYMTEIFATDLFSLLYKEENKFSYDFSKDIKHTLQICRSLLKTIAYAHSLKIYHTDISPTNILITFFDTKEGLSIKLVITDWGAAQEYQAKGSCKLVAVPCFPYSLKEDARVCGKAENTPIFFFDTCQRMDVYEIGFIIFLLLTNGEQPYPSTENMPMIFNGEALKNKGYSEKLIKLLERMLFPVYWQRPLAQEALNLFP